MNQQNVKQNNILLLFDKKMHIFYRKNCLKIKKDCGECSRKHTQVLKRKRRRIMDNLNKRKTKYYCSENNEENTKSMKQI